MRKNNSNWNLTRINSRKDAREYMVSIFMTKRNSAMTIDETAKSLDGDL